MNQNTLTARSLSMLQAVSALGTALGAAPRVIAECAGLRVVEEPFLQLASLRLSKKADRSSALGALPFDLPSTPNGWTGSAELSLARFEPNAWMLISIATRSLPESQGPWLVTDLSSRLASFRLQGARAPAVLASATSVTLPPAGFTRTLFAETTPVLLQRLGDNEYRLLIDVSLAEYLSSWLADASQMTVPGK